MRLRYVDITENLDWILAIVGAIASVLLITYSTIIFNRIVYVLPGVLTLLACVTWLIIRKRSSLSFQIEASRSKTRFFLSLYLIFLVISVLSVRFRPELYERPLLYFIVTSLMAGTIACQIIYAHERQKALIIAQIIILGVSIAWFQLLIFPNVIGIDPMYHQMLTNQILQLHSIPSGTAYSFLPLFHIMIAITSLLTDTSYKLATMLSVSFAQIICDAIFIYLLTIQILKNYRIGLFASLMVVIANQHIFMSYWSIPNAFATIFIQIIFYIIFKDNYESFLSRTSLIIVLFIVIIFTHTVASMCIAILLFVLWIASEVYTHMYSKKKISISVFLPIIFFLMMIAWWDYATGHMQTLLNLIHSGFSTDVFISQQTSDLFVTFMYTIPVTEQVFNQLGMFLFFALSFIGLFYLIFRHNIIRFSLVCIAITPLAIGFLPMLFGSTVLEQRWWYVAQILLSIPLGIAIGLFYNIFRSSNVKLLGFFIFISLFAAIMILSPSANSDNPFFSKSSTVRYSLTEAELFSINSISSKYDGQIGTDSYYPNGVDNLPINIHFSDISDNLYWGDFSKQPLQQNILIRNYIREHTFALYQTMYKLNYDPNQQLEKQGYDKTYNTNSVTMYSYHSRVA